MGVYKKEETVIRKLQEGRYFFNTPFKLFWNNEDMFLKAVELGFRPYDFQHPNEKYHWYTKWCWQEGFVENLFNMLWNQVAPQERARAIYWLIDYLPESITSSDRYLDLCRNTHSIFIKRATGKAYDALVADIEERISAFNLKKLDSLFEEHSNLIKQEESTLIDYMSNMLRHPPQVLNDRNYCLRLVKDYGVWGIESLRPLQDDIDFALTLVNAIPTRPLRGFSYRIRSAVKHGDPATILPRLKFNDELENELTINPGPVKSGVIKL